MGIGLACAAQAGISIHGSATGYQSQTRDWLTETANDIDGDGLGTDGYIFFGNFAETPAGNNTNPGNDQNGNIFGANQMSSDLLTASQPSYISTAATGAGSSNVGRYNYEAIDSPLLGDGTDRACGNLLRAASGGLVEFTVSGLAADETIRVGIVTVLNDDARARFGIPSISLSDGTDTVSVTGLPNLSNNADTTGPGWVFFDIDADGDYVIDALPDGTAPTVAGIGGVTFDTIPEPATLGLVAVFGGSVLFIRRRIML
ncbi:hypothetical protein P4B35_08400 [Pontiellaceae bacterium B12227]|nr:hypothetical protein [Pontiellaceae bacterium B12227]